MLLYKFMQRHCEALDKLERITGVPVFQGISNAGFIWMGELKSDLVEIEIRESKESIGWAYQPNANIVFFRNENHYFECWISDFKNLLETQFGAKRFIKENNPMANCLYRDENGRIIGWIEKSELLKISSTIYLL